MTDFDSLETLEESAQRLRREASLAEIDAEAKDLLSGCYEMLAECDRLLRAAGL